MTEQFVRKSKEAITYINTGDSGGTSVEMLVMSMEQQPLDIDINKNLIKNKTI